MFIHIADHDFTVSLSMCASDAYNIDTAEKCLLISYINKRKIGKNR